MLTRIHGNAAVFHRPSLLIEGEEGSGHTSHLAPAILHLMEELPVFALDVFNSLLDPAANVCSLCGDDFLRTPCSCVCPTPFLTTCRVLLRVALVCLLRLESTRLASCTFHTLTDFGNKVSSFVCSVHLWRFRTELALELTCLGCHRLRIASRVADFPAGGLEPPTVVAYSGHLSKEIRSALFHQMLHRCCICEILSSPLCST